MLFCCFVFNLRLTKMNSKKSSSNKGKPISLCELCPKNATCNDNSVLCDLCQNMCPYQM